MTTTPEPASAASLETAAAAAARSITATKLTAGPVESGWQERPAALAFLVAFTVTGAFEGTVTLAADDELVERLEYAGSVSGAAEALAPVATAIASALGAAGPVEATPLAEIETEDWPADSPVISTVTFTGSAEPEEEAEDTLLVAAFALTATPAPADEDDEMVTGPARSTISSSADTDAPLYRLSGGRAGGGPLSAEARRLGAVEVDVAAVLGETTVILHELLGWLPGVIVSLHRDVGMPVDVRIDDATVAHAEIVVLDERYALRVIDVVAGAQARVVRQRSTAQPGVTEPHP